MEILLDLLVHLRLKNFQRRWDCYATIGHSHGDTFIVSFMATSEKVKTKVPSDFQNIYGIQSMLQVQESLQMQMNAFNDTMTIAATVLARFCHVLTANWVMRRAMETAYISR